MSTDKARGTDVNSRCDIKRALIMVVGLWVFSAGLCGDLWQFRPTPKVSNAAEKTEEARIIRVNGRSFTVSIGESVYLEDSDGGKHPLEVISLYDEPLAKP